MAAGKAVSREEKREETVFWRMPLLVLAVTFIHRQRRSPDRFAKIDFLVALFRIWKTGGTPVPHSQVYLRTRMRPSSKWISLGFHLTATHQFHGSFAVTV
jgi:hypothetical protein